jgi:hypothetical protein
MSNAATPAPALRGGPPPEPQLRARRGALAAALLGVLACVLAAQQDSAQLLHSWLAAWLFFLGLSLGSMGALMMHHLTGGGWSEAVHRYFAAALAPLPLLALLFVPIAAATGQIFPWASAPVRATDWVGKAKAAYLTDGFFVARAIVLLLAWLAVAALLRRYRARPQPLVALSAVGLIVYFLTMTVAAVDWIGSLEPHWSSTALGMVVTVGQGLGAFALAVGCATRPLQGARPSPARCGDLGNLLLAFVMTWMYLAFVQYLVTWAEDLPRETVWYLPRLETGWRWLALAVIAAQFALPFSLLLFRRLTRDARTLGAIALLLLAGNWLNAEWLVLPSLAHARAALHWTDGAVTVGIGGAWLYVFLRALASASTATGAAHEH